MTHTPSRTSRLSLALIHYSVPPIVGGVESVIARHAELMTANGHRVRLVAARGDEWRPVIPLARVPLADSRHPDILSLKRDLDRGVVPPNFASLVDQLTAELRQALAGVDVAIAHNVCSLSKNLALTAALHRLHTHGHAPALILWHHDLAWTTPRYRPELHDGYPWDLLRTHWPGAIQVVVSEARRLELAGLMSLPSGDISVIPNGVSLEEFHKLDPLTQGFADRLGLAAAEPLLLLPVRLTPRKNIELAIQAVAALRRRFPRVKLVVTGPEGPHNPANAQYRQTLVDLREQLGVTESVIFLAEHTDTFLPDPVIADFFRLADALFMPSREEGFGIPLVEAALCRLPVFCADIPTLRDLGAGEARFFSPDASPDVVADLIAHTLTSSPTYRFAVRARRAYGWQGIYSTQIEPILQAAAQSRIRQTETPTG